MTAPKTPKKKNTNQKKKTGKSAPIKDVVENQPRALSPAQLAEEHLKAFLGIALKSPLPLAIESIRALADGAHNVGYELMRQNLANSQQEVAVLDRLLARKVAGE
jgi:hypothetical protein